MEACLLLDKPPTEVAALDVVTEDDLHDVLVPSYQAWDEYADEHDLDILLVEQTVAFKRSDLTGAFGTGDIFALNADQTRFYVLDWKFGHHTVSPDNNTQGLFLVAAAMEDPATADLFATVEWITIAIIQHNRVEDWSCRPDEAKAFADQLAQALKSDRLEMGDHCKWCKAKSICPLQKAQALRLNAYPVVAENLSDILAVADEVEAVIRDARAMAHQLLEEGQPVAGWKLVDKRPRRVYTDPDAVMDYCKKSRKLKAEAYLDSKLKSPAQLEKLFKREGVDFNAVSDNIASVSSGTTLAPEDDKRQGVVKTKGFGEVPEALAKQMLAN
jgi:hypothetical protein